MKTQDEIIAIINKRLHEINMFIFNSNNDDNKRVLDIEAGAMRELKREILS